MNPTKPAQQKSIRFRARSFVAFVLTPEAPLGNWLADLDNWTQNSPGFFAGRPVMLDCSVMKPDPAQLAQLVSSLADRGIRTLAIEYPERDALGDDLPPIMRASRSSETEEKRAPARPAREQAGVPEPKQPNYANALVIEAPIRSGQSVVHPHGDIIVLGSVGSGSEVVASGSIHIYGTLRGRAMAGALGNPQGRIFCRKNEAELLGVDGHYLTADDMEPASRGKPVQSYLDNGVLCIANLD